MTLRKPLAKGISILSAATAMSDALIRTFAPDALLNDAAARIPVAAIPSAPGRQRIFGDHVTLPSSAAHELHGHVVMHSPRRRETSTSSKLPDPVILT